MSCWLWVLLGLLLGAVGLGAWIFWYTKLRSPTWPKR